MRFLLVLAAALLFISPSLQGQGNSSEMLSIAAEPHHKLLFENGQVRVFGLTLDPGEATLPHRHSHYYAYLSLEPAKIGNEVKGHPPVVVELEPEELRTSKGGFNVAERNDTPDPVHLLFVETMKTESSGFFAPIGGFRAYGALYGELFESPSMRAYIFKITPGGGIGERFESYDRLIVAITDLDLHENENGQIGNFEMKAGEVRWISRGKFHSTVNVGASTAIFYTFEFN